MIEHILKSVLTAGLLVLVLWPAAVIAQNAPQCYGRVYNHKEVTRRAKIIQGPDLDSINTFAEKQNAHVVIRAVLCRTGRVTDLQLLEGTPSNLTDHIKNAVSLVSFTPAELNWHSVSQYMAFEFGINNGETKVSSEPEAKERLVESLEIMGNRRLTAEQIRSWIRTKPGETYDGDLVQSDLEVLLSKGYFDKLGTRVSTEDGPRGGVVVMFAVLELPVITEVTVNGLNQGYTLLALTKLTLVGIDKGEPFEPARAKRGVIAIKQFLESKGWRAVNVTASTQSADSSTVTVTFNVGGSRPQ